MDLLPAYEETEYDEMMETIEKIISHKNLVGLK